MRKRFIREALDEYASRHVPPDRDLWPAIRQRVQARRRFGSFRPPATRPGALSPGGRAREEDPGMGRPGRRDAWSRVRWGANALAGLTLLAVCALALALVLPGMRGGGRRVGVTPTGSAAARPSSCTEALLPQKPATPPARPVPATPTGREAALYVACAFEQDPGLRRADEAGLVQHLNAAQTVDGFTLTVERFYADANQIVVGYTIRAADWITDDHRLDPVRPTLTDSAGRTYQRSGNFQGGYSGFGGPERLNAGVVSFDASPLPPDTREETFRLSFPQAPITSIRPLRDQPTPAVTTTYNPAGTPIGQMAVGGPARRMEQVGVAGPWEFSLTLLVVHARIAEVNQSVTSAVAASYSQGDPEVVVPRCASCPAAPPEGIAITVERVVATPSETRVYLRVAAPDLGPRAGQWEIRRIGIEDPVSKPAQDITAQPGTMRRPDGGYLVRFSNPLYDKPAGEWTVAIGELFTVIPPDPADRSGRGGVIVRLTGEWVFRFEMR